MPPTPRAARGARTNTQHHVHQHTHTFQWAPGHTLQGGPPSATTVPPTPTPTPVPAPPAGPATTINTGGSSGIDGRQFGLGLLALLAVAGIVLFCLWLAGVFDSSESKATPAAPTITVSDYLKQNRGVDPNKLRVCAVQRDLSQWKITFGVHFGCLDTFSINMPNSRVHPVRSTRWHVGRAVLGYLDPNASVEDAKTMSTGEIIETDYRLVTLRLPGWFYIQKK